MTGSTRWLVLAAAAILAAGGGWLWWSQRGETAAPRTQPVVMGSVEDAVAAVGTLQPRTYVDVGTQVSGQLVEIAVGFGDRVEKGQLLARIDPRLFEAKVGANRAQLLGLQAQATEKRAQLTLADRQLARQRGLLAQRATSQEAFEAADANRKVIAAQIAGLEAQIQQTQAALDGDIANLSYTTIFAPIAGTVVDILARQGQTLNANQQAPIVLRIADLDVMTVRTQVSEADVPRLKIGMPATFTTLGQADKRRRGILRQVLPTPEVVNNVVLYPALFDVDNPDHELKPQMSAQVFFVVAEARDTPIIPASALRSRGKPGEGYFVRVIESGRAHRREVEVGVVSRISAQITAGLKPGEEVVVDPPPANAQRGQGGGYARTPRL